MHSRTTLKSIISILTLLLVVVLVHPLTNAQDASPDTKATPPTTENKVKELKDKLATRVAQLREDQKRGLYGEIADLNESSFTLKTATGEIKVNFTQDTAVIDLTNKRTERDTKFLKNGQNGSVLGLFEESKKEHQAKVILLQSLPVVYSGSITQIDKSGGTITLKHAQGTLTADYERTTKTDEYSATENKIKISGLSRLTTGDYLHLWVTPPTSGSETVTAVRLLRLSKDTFDQGIKGETTASSPSAEPKVSPRPSPKKAASSPAPTPAP